MSRETELLSLAVPRLLSWYQTVDNRLPWWSAPTPYHVWISEIMLQQTRTGAVIPYYTRFIETFPNVSALAAADDDLLMKCWEGLGYYSRARNLKKAAAQIVERFGGQLPDTVEDLLTLPGIGPYTAGAIASIAYHKPAPAVDGNVLRVVMRLLACGDEVLKDETKKKVQALLAGVYPDGSQASALTEGIMILGETVCIAGGEAHCGVCPLSDICAAYEGKIVSLFPVRSPKKEKRQEALTVFLLCKNGTYAIAKRPPTGLLAGLYEFPNTKEHLTAGQAEAYVVSLGASPSSLTPLGKATHVFTHVIWNMVGWHIDVDGEIDGLTFLPAKDILEKCAIPTAFKYYLKKMKEI